jgi:hypothetical protein
MLDNSDYLGGPGFLGNNYLPAINTSRNILLTRGVEKEQRLAYRNANATTKKKLETQFGIKGDYTFFDRVKGFNIVNRVPHDPMHVFLERVLKFELYLVYHWIAMVLGMGVSTLDMNIHHFAYAEGEKSDKPAKIDKCHISGSQPKSDGKIKQTAGMCIVLARNLVATFGEPSTVCIQLS